MYYSLVNIIIKITCTCACKTSALMTCKTANKYCSSCRTTTEGTFYWDSILAVVLYALLSVQACKYEQPCGAHRSAFVAWTPMSRITVYIDLGVLATLREWRAFSLALHTVYAPFSVPNHSSAGCLKSTAPCHQHNPGNVEAVRSGYKHCKGKEIT